MRACSGLLSAPPPSPDMCAHVEMGPCKESSMLRHGRNDRHQQEQKFPYKKCSSSCETEPEFLFHSVVSQLFLLQFLVGNLNCVPYKISQHRNLKFLVPIPQNIWGSRGGRDKHF